MVSRQRDLTSISASISLAARSRSFKPERLRQPAAPGFLEKPLGSVPATSPVTNMTRRAISGIVGARGAVELRAVQPRHLQIADDQVVRLLATRSSASIAVARAIHHEAGVLQRLRHRRAERRLVFHDQHRAPATASGRAPSARGSAGLSGPAPTGSSTENDAPPPPRLRA